MATRVFLIIFIVLFFVSSTLLTLEIIGTEQVKLSTWVGYNSQTEVYQKEVEEFKAELTKVNAELSAIRSSITTIKTTEPQSSSTNLFEQCVTRGGLEGIGKTATLSSNRCFIDGEYYRPATFSITEETLTFVGLNNDEAKQFTNKNGEVFILPKGVIDEFGSNTQKDDRFIVDAQVLNRNVSSNSQYEFTSISRADTIG